MNNLNRFAGDNAADRFLYGCFSKKEAPDKTIRSFFFFMFFRGFIILRNLQLSELFFPVFRVLV